MTKKSILTMLPLCGALLVTGLVGCGPTSSETSKTPTSTPSQPVETKYTVAFKDGDKVLKSVEVKENAKVEEWDPTSEVKDKEFFGWFAEPTLKHEFDFTKGITADTEIFGSFVGYKKDERKWAIAGSGTSSILKSSNWGKVFNEEHYMKNESTDSKNVFTITVNLFEGDQFQFTSPVITEDKIAWGHQRGGAYVKDSEVDGTKYFEAGGGLTGENYTSNITALVSGKYQFTLNTYPAGDFFKDNTTNSYDNRNYYDAIHWTRLGDSEEVQAETENIFYIKGSDISDWKDYVNNNTMMVEDLENKGTYVLKNIYLKASDEFMFASKVKDVKTGVLSDGNIYIKAENLTEEAKKVATGTHNIKVNEDGYYTFTYNFEAKTLDIAKVEYTPKAGAYYIDGDWCSWGGVKGTEENPDAYKLVVSSENPDVYEYAQTITLTEGQAVGVQYYDAATESYNGFYSAKNFVANDNFDLVSGNNAVCKVAGTYKASFNAYRHLLELTAVTAE